VVLVIGVNGSGKTTTIAKLAHLFQEEDYAVMLAAGDTFRAAAIGQLGVWADRWRAHRERPRRRRSGQRGVRCGEGRHRTGTDALIVDTAGRLQNRRELMDELAKIRRVLGRLNPAAPHDVVLVLDATNGQNALAQIETFKEVAGVTGLIMTKLDGTARGGVLVAAAEQYGLPIHAIGVGETIDDLRPFDPDLVARVIAGWRMSEAVNKPRKSGWLNIVRLWPDAGLFLAYRAWRPGGRPALWAAWAMWWRSPNPPWCSSRPRCWRWWCRAGGWGAFRPCCGFPARW
jgi:signal recognition particle GTPase